MSTTELVGRARLAHDHEALTRLEALLLRYPALEPNERDEAGTLLRNTGPVDMGLLSINTAAWSKAEQFRRDHPDFFRPSWKVKLLWVALAVAAVASIWWLWDIGVE